MTDKLDPAEVLRRLEILADIRDMGRKPDATAAERQAIALIRQMQEAMVEADRRADEHIQRRQSVSYRAFVAALEPLAPFLQKPKVDSELMGLANKVAEIARNYSDEDAELLASFARSCRILARRGLKIVEI